MKTSEHNWWSERLRFDTNPELAMKQPQHDFSAQTDLIATTSLPQVSLLEKSQPNLTLELTRGSPPGTPSRKKKKRNTANSNNCGNVFSMGVKWTMIMAQFRLMVIVRIANTGSIYTTLAYLAKMKMKRCLLKSHNVIVKLITPIKSFGQSMS